MRADITSCICPDRGTPILSRTHINLVYAELPILAQYKTKLGKHQLGWLTGPCVGLPIAGFGRESGRPFLQFGAGFDVPLEKSWIGGVNYRFPFGKGELILDGRVQAGIGNSFFNQNGQNTRRFTSAVSVGWNKTITRQRTTAAIANNPGRNGWGIQATLALPRTQVPVNGLTQRYGLGTESAIGRRNWRFMAGIQIENTQYEWKKGANIEKAGQYFKLLQIPEVASQTDMIRNEWSQWNMPIGVSRHFDTQLPLWVRFTATPALERSQSVGYWTNNSPQPNFSETDPENNLKLAYIGIGTGIEYAISRRLSLQTGLNFEVSPFLNTHQLRHYLPAWQANLVWKP
jgi:hypothetical protein